MSEREKFIENSLGALKWVLAVFVMYIGVMIAIGPLTPIEGILGVLYSSRLFVVTYGAWTFLAGAALLYGKWQKSKKWTGVGLFNIYLNALFACIINGFAHSWSLDSWPIAAVFALITGLLWLRWKFKTEYINPNHFRREVRGIKESEEPY